MSIWGRILNVLRGLFVSQKRGLDASIHPLTVFFYKKRIVMLGHVDGILKLLGSTNGYDFSVSEKKVQIVDSDNNREEVRICYDFSVAQSGREYIMTYVRKQDHEHVRVTASSRNIVAWVIIAEEKAQSLRYTLVPERKNCEYMNAYTGTESIVPAHFSSNWKIGAHPVLEARADYFDTELHGTLGAAKTSHGVFVLYDASYRGNEGEVQLSVGGTLFSEENPSELRWRSDEPLWSDKVTTQGSVTPIGALVTDNHIYLYWNTSGRGLIAVVIPNMLVTVDNKPENRVEVTRRPENPLMSPREGLAWEREGVFNPSAIEVDGDVHIIYRAVGSNGVSMFGYGRSSDGHTFDVRDKDPAYWPRMAFEGAQNEPIGFNPAYGSGGGWGGCEDPKITYIDDHVYLTYVAHDGGWPARTAISSIHVDDFLARKWNKWSMPALLTPPGPLSSKSAIILPEKVNGKYVVFHRIWPDIVMDYVDDLNFYSDDNWINATPSVLPWKENGKVMVCHGTWPDITVEQTQFSSDKEVFNSDWWKEKTKDTYRIQARDYAWDSHKISLADAPIKTDDGWLGFYSAVDKRDSTKYKMGAMLLDKDDPSKVLHRTNTPMLEPDEPYENDWKPGIVYPSGSAMRGDDIYVYYGGGDKHVAAVTAPLDRLLWQLKKEVETPIFSKVHVV